MLAGAAAFYAVTAAKLLWWHERPYIVTWGGRWAVGTLAVVAVLGAVALRTRRPDVRRLAAAAGAVVLVGAALVEAAIVADGRDSHPASRVVAGAYAAVAIALAVRTRLARHPGRATALATVAASLAAVVAIWLTAELNHLFSPG